jgi:epsin
MALPQDDNFSIPPTMPPVTASGSSSFQALSAEPTPAPAPAPRMEAVPSFNFGDAFGDMNFNSTPSGNADVLGAAPFLATTTTATTAAGVPAATSYAPAPISQPQLAPTSTSFGSLQQNQFTPGVGIMQTNQFIAQAPNPAFSVQLQQGFLVPQAPTTSTTAFVNPSVSFQAAQPQPATAFMNQTPVSSGSNLGMLSQPANQSTLFSFESAASHAGVKLQSQPVSQPQTAPQPQSGKFETRSSVWADTLSRGLVNLNISGRKCFFLVLHLASFILSFIFFSFMYHLF